MNPPARRAAALALPLALMTAAPALAHHAFATFDAQKSVTLEGAVKEFQWTNPHIWIQLVVKGPDGKDVEWSIEGSSVTVLSRQGWNRKSIKAGDKLVAVVHPSKEGTADGQLVSATVNGAPLGAHD